MTQLCLCYLRTKVIRNLTCLPMLQLWYLYTCTIYRERYKQIDIYIYLGLVLEHQHVYTVGSGLFSLFCSYLSGLHMSTVIYTKFYRSMIHSLYQISPNLISAVNFSFIISLHFVNEFRVSVANFMLFFQSNYSHVFAISSFHAEEQLFWIIFWCIELQVFYLLLKVSLRRTEDLFTGIDHK